MGDEVNWLAIEAEYRSTSRRVRHIARCHGVPESTIRLRAKVGRWQRIHAQPRRAAQESGREVVATHPIRATPEASGDAVAAGNDLVQRMLAELDFTTTHLDEIEEAIEAETREDENGSRRAAMLKAVSLPARAMTLKTLSQALAVLKELDQGEAKGKKARRQDSAEKAASGRFAPAAPPKLVVDNEA